MRLIGRDRTPADGSRQASFRASSLASDRA